jgi:hypothetical protein
MWARAIGVGLEMAVGLAVILGANGISNSVAALRAGASHVRQVR